MCNHRYFSNSSTDLSTWKDSFSRYREQYTITYLFWAVANRSIVSCRTEWESSCHLASFWSDSEYSWLPLILMCWYAKDFSDSTNCPERSFLLVNTQPCSSGASVLTIFSANGGLKGSPLRRFSFFLLHSRCWYRSGFTGINSSKFKILNWSHVQPG